MTVYSSVKAANIFSCLDMPTYPNLQSVDTKTKTAFTRKYNKESAPLPYSVGMAVSKKKGAPAAAEEFMEEDGMVITVLNK